MQERLDVTPRSVRMLNQNFEAFGVVDWEEEEKDEEQPKSCEAEKFPDFSQLHFALSDPLSIRRMDRWEKLPLAVFRAMI